MHLLLYVAVWQTQHRSIIFPLYGLLIDSQFSYSELFPATKEPNLLRLIWRCWAGDRGAVKKHICCNKDVHFSGAIFEVRTFSREKALTRTHLNYYEVMT
jgi:hypothetical protein